MKLYYSLFLFMLLGIQISQAKDVVEVQTKVIDKTFSVNPDATLHIENAYGNINLSSWNKNVIRIHVEIKVDGRNIEDVRERLRSITVAFSADRNDVSAETDIGNSHGNNTDFTINYFVKLPKTGNVDLENTYGDIALDELLGETEIDLEYGNLNFGRLMNTVNNFDLEYVTSASIKYVKTAVIQADYSDLHIGHSDEIELHADYTDVAIDQIKTLTSNMDYGNLSIGKAASVVNSSDYTNISVDYLTKKFVSSGDYGSIVLDHVKSGFDKISITADYADVSINIEPDAGYKLDAAFDYGDLRYPSNLDFQTQIEKSFSATYKGQAGNGAGEIFIRMDYGSAKIKLTF